MGNPLEAKEGRWNYQQNRWEHRKGLRQRRRGRVHITWGPWEINQRAAPRFSQKALLTMLSNFVELMDPQQKPDEPDNEFMTRVAEAEQERLGVSICAIGKHFHKSNAAVKRKIGRIRAKLEALPALEQWAGEPEADFRQRQKAMERALQIVRYELRDYTAAEDAERARQADKSFTGEDIASILGVKLFPDQGLFPDTGT